MKTRLVKTLFCFLKLAEGEELIFDTCIILLFTLYHRPDQAPQGNNRTERSFDIFGPPNSSKEIIHYVYGIIDQLLPAVKRDLYEEVDGEKNILGSDIKPEVQPLFPGTVKMHRQANTSDEHEVFIKNHFNRSDFLNMSATLDLDFEYSDSALINKSNGMLKESHAYLSERLNFGTSIRTKQGFDVTSMNITFSSHVSLVEPDLHFFDYAAEAKIVNLRVFVQLKLPVSNGNFSVKRKPQFTSSRQYTNSSLNRSSQAVTRPARRRRRSLLGDIWNIVKREFKSSPIVFEKELFETTILSIPVIGKSKLWLEKPHNEPLVLGVDFTVDFKGAELELINLKYQGRQIEAGDTEPTSTRWSVEIVSYLFMSCKNCCYYRSISECYSDYCQSNFMIRERW